MRKQISGLSRFGYVAVFTIASIAVSGCSGFTAPMNGATPMVGSDAAAAAAPAVVDAAAAAGVTIANSKYQPKTLRTKVGVSVKWSNKDSLAHTVTAIDNSFSSSFMTKGHSFKHTFTKPGKYPYHCKIHPYMTGLVIVTK